MLGMGGAGAVLDDATTQPSHLPLTAFMTWKSHYVANGALALALTGRPEVALAAVATATLPDQLEVFLPLGRHRGATHWLLFWMLALLCVPIYLGPSLAHWPTHAWGHGRLSWPGFASTAAMAAFGCALGPLLHVLLDGCSSDGVPVGPFVRARVKLSLYRTWNRAKWPWDLSEMLFLLTLLTGSALAWRMRWR